MQAVRADHDTGTGSISGFVLSEEMLPIAGGVRVVLLVEDRTAWVQETLTDAMGAFAFSFIPPGRYYLEAVAPGYETALRDVTVVAGQLAQLEFYMEPVFADVPFFVTDTITRMVGGGTYKWWFNCGQSLLYEHGVPYSLVVVSLEKYCIGGNNCNSNFGCENASSGCQGSYSSGPPPEGEHNGYGSTSSGAYNGGYRNLLINHTNWMTQLAEVTWSPSSTVSGRGVLFEILGPNVTNGNGGHTSRCGSINQSDPRDFLVLSDQPPFRIEINDELLQARGISEDDRCCDWRFRLFPGWCDLGNCNRWGPDANVLGIVAPTSVTVYYSLFFKEPAPPGWSTLPD